MAHVWGIIRAGFANSATLAHVRSTILARADCGDTRHRARLGEHHRGGGRRDLAGRRLHTEGQGVVRILDTVITVGGKNCYGKISRKKPKPTTRKSEDYLVSNLKS
jgi:hypothetical protein